MKGDIMRKIKKPIKIKALKNLEEIPKLLKRMDILEQKLFKFKG